ncbi:MAG: dockerin type I domain-containing protein [Planctomycetota bacterium]
MLVRYLLIVIGLGVCTDASAQCFRRGDVNADGRVDMDDEAWLNAYLFTAPPPQLPCLDAADVNDDGQVMISDVVYLLSFLVNNGAPPPAPGPCVCGPDPTPDLVGCGTFTCAFLRGDADSDGIVGPMDAAFINAFLFAAGPAPACMDAADANDDGQIDVSDVLLIQGGGPIPYPNPECGIDVTPDNLDCGCYVCPVGANFIRGDVDGDGAMDPLDMVALNAILFLGAVPVCADAADVNDDGFITLQDTTLLGAALFSWTALPAPSAHSCGLDPTPDALGCATPTTCNCLPIDFIRGDCNTDNCIDIGDIINILCIVFQAPGTCTATCRDACDVNDDGCLDISDPIRVLNYLFGGGLPLAQPFPDCGHDPTPRENLGCRVYSGCPAF